MQTVEDVARQLCQSAGYNPDDMVARDTPDIVATPLGNVVRYSSTAWKPMWQMWQPLVETLISYGYIKL